MLPLICSLGMQWLYPDHQAFVGLRRDELLVSGDLGGSAGIRCFFLRSQYVQSPRRYARKSLCILVAAGPGPDDYVLIRPQRRSIIIKIVITAKAGSTVADPAAGITANKPIIESPDQRLSLLQGPTYHFKKETVSQVFALFQ